MMPHDEVSIAIASIRRSPLAAIVTDSSGVDNPIVAVNQPFELLTGYSEAELIGQNCRILAGPRTDREKAARLRQAVEQCASVVVELVNYRKDGSAFVNAVMIAPLLGADGRPCCFVGTQMEARSDAREQHQAAATLEALLTPRQCQVLRLMASGLRNREIGAKLGLTEQTVKMHRGALVRRLGLTTSIEAVRMAVRANL